MPMARTRRVSLCGTAAEALADDALAADEATVAWLAVAESLRDVAADGDVDAVVGDGVGAGAVAVVVAVADADADVVAVALAMVLAVDKATVAVAFDDAVVNAAATEAAAMRNERPERP